MTWQFLQRGVKSDVTIHAILLRTQHVPRSRYSLRVLLRSSPPSGQAAWRGVSRARSSIGSRRGHQVLPATLSADAERLQLQVPFGIPIGQRVAGETSFICHAADLAQQRDVLANLCNPRLHDVAINHRLFCPSPFAPAPDAWTGAATSAASRPVSSDSECVFRTAGRGQRTGSPSAPESGCAWMVQEFRLYANVQVESGGPGLADRGS